MTPSGRATAPTMAFSKKRTWPSMSGFQPMAPQDAEVLSRLACSSKRPVTMVSSSADGDAEQRQAMMLGSAMLASDR